MALNERQLAVLDELKKGPRSTQRISAQTGMPQPSVRRVITELQGAGYVIDRNNDTSERVLASADVVDTPNSDVVTAPAVPV